MCKAAVIHQLKIERFRGIKCLKWNPSPDMNVILGGGDVGKTTLLDAIALLLSPSNTFVLSEADYWLRNYDAEFVIQAAISLPASSEISDQQKFAWPWEWNGEDAVPPIVPNSEEDDIPTPDQPVYRLQVRGSPDLEINWEIIQPNDDIDSLSAAVRRKIGCVRLGGDDRNDRDLRLVYGSALDRLLADKGLRARIGQQVSEIDLQEQMGDILFRWESGCTEENIIALVDGDKLTELIKDEEGRFDPERCRTLTDRLGFHAWVG